MRIHFKCIQMREIIHTNIYGRAIETIRSSPSECSFKKRCYENMQQIDSRTPIPKCDLNKVASYFQNTFLFEHLCRAASERWLYRSVFRTLSNIFDVAFLPK